MLTALAYGMVATFMTLIMTKRMSPLSALIVVPVAFGLLGGFGFDLGVMIVDGVSRIAPTGVMLMFAILYFAVMIDAGMFEPFVAYIVRRVHGDPMKIVVGTAVLAVLVSLDGDGSTTYMITTAAMLPLYQRLGMRPLVLACVTMLASGVMNILPWGGPTARAATSLGLDVSVVFVPLIPAMLAGVVWVLYVSYRLGMRERRRLADTPAGSRESESLLDEEEANPNREVVPTLRGRRRLGFNLLLTMVLLTALVAGILPLPALFMLAFAIALSVNFPGVEAQKHFLSRNAGNVLAVVALVFAAGVFTGILSGTKMVDAMAGSVVALVPPSMGPYLAVVTGVLSIPFTFLIPNDAFYFGVLPVLAKAGAAYGISPAEMARASLIGQPIHLLSPLVPSTFLLVGLAGVDFDDHQRYTLRWAFVSALVLLGTALLLSVVPFVGRGSP